MMTMDLVGPERRGLAMGLNEAAGYLGVAGTALATGYIASTFGLRPWPFLLGAAFIAIGLGLSVLAVRETHHHATAEAAGHVSLHAGAGAGLSTKEIFTLTSFRDRSLSSVSQAGMVNNLMTAWPGGCFLSCSLRQGWASNASGSSRRSTRPCGVRGKSSRARSRTGSAANR